MSCIPKILALKGDKEFLPVKDVNIMGIGVEGGGHHKQYDYLITFNDRGFRCGYVAINANHKFYNNNFIDDDNELDVHGGITFHDKHVIVDVLLSNPCDDKWIGFDAGHYLDIPDEKNVKKYFPNIRETRLNHVSKIMENYKIKGYSPSIKTFEFMENECKRLIDQLIEIDKQ